MYFNLLLGQSGIHYIMPEYCRKKGSVFLVYNDYSVEREHFCIVVCLFLLFYQNWDDQAHLTFIQTHLSELLELLVEPGQLSSSGQVLRDSQLTSEALESLSLLLEGSVSHSRTVHPIHKLLSRSPLQSQAGFSKLSHSYSLQQFQGFLHQALCLNPFGISTCSESGKRLAWALQGKLEVLVKGIKL